MSMAHVDWNGAADRISWQQGMKEAINMIH